MRLLLTLTQSLQKHLTVGPGLSSTNEIDRLNLIVGKLQRREHSVACHIDADEHHLEDTSGIGLEGPPSEALMPADHYDLKTEY